MSKSKKSSKVKSSLKNHCEVLCKCCNDCCNNVIDMLCVCKENCRKDLCEYLKCCLALCEVCNCCCCCINMNCMTSSMQSDLKSKCLALCRLCDKLEKSLTTSEFKKINCGKIRSCCGSICGVRKSKKSSKKGGGTTHSAEYYGKNSGKYFGSKNIKTTYDTFYGKSVGKSQPFTNLAPGPGFENMRGGGKCRFA
jgi:hypothetical protein